MNWPLVYLGDVANIQTGKSNKEDAIPDGEYIFFDRSQQIQRSNRFLFDTEAVIVPGEGSEFIPRYFAGPFDLHQRVYAITDFQGVDGKFLYYAIMHKRRYFAQVAIGATVKSLRKGMFERFAFNCPTLENQHRIASILSTYDDLIENNQRRIQLLEQSAQLLYKEWFVHLRFPGHEHVTITNGVPEGWIKKPLSTLCTDIRKSIHPKALSPDVPYIGLEHIPRHSITLDSWGKAADVNSNKFRFSKGDILFGKIRPYFHKVGFALVDGITSSDAIVIRPTEDRLYFYVLSLLASNEFVALASKTVREGSKMPRADWKFLLKSEFKVPSMALLDFFNETMNPICNQLRTLALHNRKLAHSRDLLLSRLMNGEISI